MAVTSYCPALCFHTAKQQHTLVAVARHKGSGPTNRGGVGVGLGVGDQNPRSLSLAQSTFVQSLRSEPVESSMQIFFPLGV